MIDIKQYRLDKEHYKQGAKSKGVDVDWERFDQLDESIRTQKTQHENNLKKRNELSQQIHHKQKTGNDTTEEIKQVKMLKAQIQKQEATLAQLQEQRQKILLTIPNPPLSDVIIGGSDKDNKIIETVGSLPTFDFEPKPHWEILEKKGYLDQDRAVKLSGSRFQIVKGGLAQLEFALIQWAIQKLTAKGFELLLVPQLVQGKALEITGFLPNDSTNLYRVNPASTVPQEDREEDDLWLIGTAEVALVAQHADELFTQEELPKRYVGFSSCYRREAGTYGKDTKGLIRLHQFEKIEMVSFVNPGESALEHELLREIEEEIYQELGIPYNRIDICSGDLGAPAAKKYDLEAWFPGIGLFKEVTSTSNTTDFQTRRGNIKVQQGKEKHYAHSLNGTAIALGRTLAAIVENYQTKEGDIRVPDVLQVYIGTDLL